MDCFACKATLTEARNPSAVHHELINRRDVGGLVYPSRGLVKILQYAETIFRSYMSVHQMNARFSPLFLKVAVMERADTRNLLGMAEHAMETQTGVSNHHEKLVYLILDKFYQTRCRQITKLHNIELHEHHIRQRNNHLTLFAGQ